MKAKKPATLFDHLANITWKKKPWSELTETDQKSFSPYLINRWLSMNMNYIELVDMFQQYTIGPLKKKHVYQLYFDFLLKLSIINFEPGLLVIKEFLFKFTSRGTLIK